MCPCKASEVGGTTSSALRLLNSCTLASSVFVTFSTWYNLQTNSSASWKLDVVRYPSPRCWSSLYIWRIRSMTCCGQKSRRQCRNRLLRGSKKSWVLYTDSGNESFCLISWIGKYFFCLDVHAFIHNWLHFMLEKKTRSSSRMSVSRAATTTSSVSAWTQCNTTLVSASSWLALSISMSTNGSVHWVSSAVRNPPATTIILSPGAWAISSLESRRARSCLLEGTARKSFQFWGSGTVLSSTIFLMGRAFLYRFCGYHF